MQIDITTSSCDLDVEATPHLTGHVDRDGKHQVWLAGSVHIYATPAALSELGHRFIELAAIAEEREHGPVDLERTVA